MRLREIQSILSDCIEDLKVPAEGMPDKQNVRIKNHLPAINAIKQISRIDAFADDIRQLSSIGDIYNNLSNNFIVPASVHSEFHRILSQIKTRAEHLLEALTMVLPKIDKNSIVVKLPNFDSFKDLKYYLEEFETILEQSLSFDSLKSNIKIRGFDTGSYWIEIGLGSVLALQFFGGLAWAAAVIRKKKIEGDVFKEKAKHLVIKNEALEEIKNGLSKSIATLVDSEAKNLLETNKVKYGNEEFERVKHSIRLLTDLLFKGAEVKPAEISPEEVKNLFPDFKVLDLIESRTKAIGYKEDKSKT